MSVALQSAKDRDKQRDLESFETKYTIKNILVINSEISEIAWLDIRLDDRAIYLSRSKASNSSILYISDRLYTVLNRRYNSCRSDSYVFTNKNGDGLLLLEKRLNVLG